ncbi:unnamed protein product [Calypogeia fissa]
MAVPSNQYVPVRPKQYPKSRDALSVDAKFWRSFKAKPPSQLIGAVSNINFCPAPPHDFAVTSSTRVTIYDGKTCEVKKTISRFTDVAYSGAFRADGQLIVAGGETGIVQVFDAGSRTILRQLKGHKRAVHWVRYSLQDKLHVLSGSDDNTVRWWDVAAQEPIQKLEEHTDYVRCGASSPASADLWATGSYDHSVRIWDVRTSKSILQLQHGAPLEDVLFFPSGGLVATAGATEVKIWDILGGGRLLHVLGSHQKTVTKLCITTPQVSGSGIMGTSPRLLSASLDGHVKVFELEGYKVTHAARYPDPLLSMDISPTCTTMAVGMASGKLTIRQRPNAVAKEDAIEAPSTQLSQPGGDITRTQKPLNPNNFRYFLRGRSEKASESDYVMARQKRPSLAKYDRFLRSFQYKDALTAALSTSDPTVVVAVMEELVARSGLVSALSSLEAPTVEVLLSFLSKYTTIPRFSRLLVPLTLKVIDLYANIFGSSPAIHHQVSLLRERVALEVRLQVSLQALQGVIQPLMHASVRT